MGKDKSETFTFRIDPELKYMGELLARKQHRKLTHVVRDALIEMLKKEMPDDEYFKKESKDA